MPSVTVHPSVRQLLNRLLMLVSRPLFALIVHLQGAEVYSATNSRETEYGV
jgi:hypothetical protein